MLGGRERARCFARAAQRPSDRLGMVSSVPACPTTPAAQRCVGFGVHFSSGGSAFSEGPRRRPHGAGLIVLSAVVACRHFDPHLPRAAMSRRRRAPPPSPSSLRCWAPRRFRAYYGSSAPARYAGDWALAAQSLIWRAIADACWRSWNTVLNAQCYKQLARGLRAPRDVERQFGTSRPETAYSPGRTADDRR